MFSEQRIERYTEKKTLQEKNEDVQNGQHRSKQTHTQRTQEKRSRKNFCFNVALLLETKENRVVNKWVV